MKKSFILAYSMIILLLWLICVTLLHKSPNGDIQQHTPIHLSAQPLTFQSTSLTKPALKYYVRSTSRQLRPSPNTVDFEEILDIVMSKPDHLSDFEVVDMLEQFFWGQTNGVAIEIGVSDISKSKIRELYRIGWRRILIEGNPYFWKDILSQAMGADVVTAPICKQSQLVHYVNNTDYTSGILEFMTVDFLRTYYYEIYESSRPFGNISAIENWATFPYVYPMHCHTMSYIISTLSIKHISMLFIDEMASELTILQSFDWNTVKIDVICISIDSDTSHHQEHDNLITYLQTKGYRDSAGQQGRNRWFVRIDFYPSKRYEGSTFRGAQVRVLLNQYKINPHQVTSILTQ